MTSGQFEIFAWMAWTNSATLAAQLLVEFDFILLFFMVVLMFGAKKMWTFAAMAREQEKD